MMDYSTVWSEKAEQVIKKEFPELADDYNEQAALAEAHFQDIAFVVDLSTRFLNRLRIKTAIKEVDTEALEEALGHELYRTHVAQPVITRQRTFKRSRVPEKDYTPITSGSRTSCLDCCRKHIGHAIVLLEVSAEGEPYKRWFAIGHLGEAEAESRASYPRVADTIRLERRNMMKNRLYTPDLIPLFDVVDKAESS